MTPAQETANAISITLPTAALALNTFKHPHNPFMILLLVGSVTHLPISFTYHILSALNFFPDKLDNNMRRLDQSMQHIVGCLYAFALSRGSKQYLALNILLNLHGLSSLWRKQTSNDGRRWIPILFSIFLYTAPILWQGDVHNYAKAIASITIGGISFIPQINTSIFHGWGHSIFHVILAFHAQALANSVVNPSQPENADSSTHPPAASRS